MEKFDQNILQIKLSCQQVDINFFKQWMYYVDGLISI